VRRRGVEGVTPPSPPRPISAGVGHTYDTQHACPLTGNMRCVDDRDSEYYGKLTTFLRSDQSDLAVDLRRALVDREIDPATSAVADLCNESALLSEGVTHELHHLVIVDKDRRAYVGLLTRTASSAHFSEWRQVFSAPIRPDLAQAWMRRMNQNYGQRPWDDGLGIDLDPAITHPKDIIYNRSIQGALALLAGPP